MATQRHQGLDPDQPGWADPAPAPMSREDRLLTRCAWCERVKVADDWHRPENAIRSLRTYDWPEPPLFTDGICDSCATFLTGARTVDGPSAGEVT